jgi:hypothetical protein
MVKLIDEVMAQVNTHLKLIQLAQAQGGMAYPPNWGEVGAHFHNLGAQTLYECHANSNLLPIRDRGQPRTAALGNTGNTSGILLSTEADRALSDFPLLSSRAQL